MRSLLGFSGTVRAGAGTGAFWDIPAQHPRCHPGLGKQEHRWNARQTRYPRPRGNAQVCLGRRAEVGGARWNWRVVGKFEQRILRGLRVTRQPRAAKSIQLNCAELAYMPHSLGAQATTPDRQVTLLGRGTRPAGCGANVRRAVERQRQRCRVGSRQTVGAYRRA